MSIFQNVPRPKIQRATFDLSRSRKLSMNIGQLIPVLCEEVVPGDKFDISTESMIRFAPMIAPVMHRMNAYIHYFYVPNRLLWEQWEEFITGTADLTLPSGPFEPVPVGSLGDHLGLPVGDFSSAADLNISTMPIRAYYRIWNDYYRDGALEAEKTIEDVDTSWYTMMPEFSAWEKDYFTSALKSPQAGNKVSMAANVEYRKALLKTEAGSVPGNASLQNIAISEGGTPIGRLVTATAPSTPLVVENIDTVSIDVEELRMATRLQRWLERNARSGSRYVEHLLAHWGVRSSDSRLDRPEYLGGGKTPVIISDVPNMTGTENAPQGTLAGNGLSIGQSNRASKYIEEHGYIIAIMKVMPESAYFQGIPRHFSRQINLDFYFPEFAQLGEQEILNKEIVTINGAGNENTWGYQSRYAEYKYGQSTIHGKFRENLEFWHMARKFTGIPSLNSDFIRCDKISDSLNDPWRIFAVTADGTEQLYVQLYHRIKATRPMPFLNDPTL